MMNLFKRGLIFGTFLGCSLSVALLAASLSTDNWVHADAKRITNPYDSEGNVFLGLFKGRRDLNVGYGWRTYAVSSKYTHVQMFLIKTWNLFQYQRAQFNARTCKLAKVKRDAPCCSEKKTPAESFKKLCLETKIAACLT